LEKGQRGAFAKQVEAVALPVPKPFPPVRVQKFAAKKWKPADMEKNF
jgi:hypothetical protein